MLNLGAGATNNMFAEGVVRGEATLVHVVNVFREYWFLALREKGLLE